METNLGPVDRAIRFVCGLAACGVGLYLHTWVGLAGLIPIATAILGWCPFYASVGLSTCPEQEPG